MAKRKSLEFVVPTDATYVNRKQDTVPIYDEQLHKTQKVIDAARTMQPYDPPLENVNPEFDIITASPLLKSAGKYALRKGDNLIGNVLERTPIGRRTFPTDMAYRTTMKQEIDDIMKSGVIRSIPEGVTVQGTKPRVPGKIYLDKPKGQSHGGKAFSKGKPWTGSTAGTDDGIIYAVPGNQTQWRVGFHGHYSAPQDFNSIPNGKGLWLPFNKETGVVDDLTTKGLKVWKRLPNGRYRRY